MESTTFSRPDVVIRRQSHTFLLVDFPLNYQLSHCEPRSDDTELCKSSTLYIPIGLKLKSTKYKNMIIRYYNYCNAVCITYIKHKYQNLQYTNIKEHNQCDIYKP